MSRVGWWSRQSIAAAAGENQSVLLQPSSSQHILLEYLKMIDNKMLIWRKKYQKLPQCLNNTIISDKREESNNKINVNLNIIKNIKNTNLNNSKTVDART